MLQIFKMVLSPAFRRIILMTKPPKGGTQNR